MVNKMNHVNISIEFENIMYLSNFKSYQQHFEILDLLFAMQVYIELSIDMQTTANGCISKMCSL